MICLGYIRLSVGTLRSSWDLWWILRGGVHNPKLLLATHFPNSVVTEEEAAPAAARCAKHLDWWVATRVVTYTRMKWTIDSCAPYKSPGMAGIYLALLQEGQKIWVPYLVRIFHACLVTGYIPAIWCQVKEVFISKPSRNSYTGPRDFTPISLTSLLRKTTDSLVDRFLRDEILAFMSLHPNQHAYLAAKSVETALHQLFVHVGKVLDQQKTDLGVFLDIDGAFNNTSYDSMCAALFKHRLTTTFYGGLELPWKAVWLQRPSVDPPGALGYLKVAYREVLCCCSYGALLLTI